MKPFALVRIVAMLLIISSEVVAQTNAVPAGDLPYMLDFSKFYRKRFINPTNTDKDLAPLVGRQTYDGLPFQVEGRATLYGRKQVRSPAGAAKYPNLVGLPVGRMCDELHLLHATQWADVEGETIAFVALNYDDGSRHEFPIRYGGHVRDWLRLRSEEEELLTDPNTKVVFRGPTGKSAYKSTVRLFKSMLTNPHPKKMVTTLDVVSARHLAAYDLVAITLAKRDTTRAITATIKDSETGRHFNRATTIRVLDPNGKPISGALVDPGMTVDKTGVIAAPLYTATNGEAVIRYPGMQTTGLYVDVRKDGYMPQSLSWSAKTFGKSWWHQVLEYAALMHSFVPATNTLTLVVSNSPAIKLPALP